MTHVGMKGITARYSHIMFDLNPNCFKPFTKGYSHEVDKDFIFTR